ncbi:Gfo/Idh/MocA family oxidoreductase [Streptomyces sp. ACA25]|uniref:Gfo/Idh/MocA family protein n=1 Tax=Streptomyces sp. ACA25 TaxID=3022596 RepID=UPI002307C5A7|nr:Gfo/Idh/MocA family oxidoreductase [Streptomyces sp. ACA25]MDB1088969.1 Gfo/Idh/MocA family oxidoreductase [Streptomyces sp. ACA25]
MGDIGTDGTQEPVRWGILATGSIASRFVTDLRTVPDARVAAVGSRSAGSAQAFAERFGIPRAHGSWAELAADSDVDVIYVATPHNAHRAAVLACLEAGKPVLCEKPFTLNEDEAQELVRTARERGVFLMEAMWTYCNPVMRQVAALVRDGAVGEVRAVHADFGLAGPFPPGHRLLDPASGGGALLDLGVYPVSFAHLMLGEPADVTAWARLRGGVDENTGMLLGYDSGAVAALTCSLVADTPQRAAVTGTAGRIEFPRGFFHPERCVLYRDGEEPEEITGPAPGSTFVHQAAEVMRCLRAGETESSVVPLDGTLAVMRTLDTVRERIGLRFPGE